MAKFGLVEMIPKSRVFFQSSSVFCQHLLPDDRTFIFSNLVSIVALNRPERKKLIFKASA